ncbi:hypothetical protein GPB2148_66 [marine gamma proteobacterium HTCC2148]|nr:hypothetical protein GPB2148_66 [marine gamma proteobacterium HTCC2148]
MALFRFRQKALWATYGQPMGNRGPGRKKTRNEAGLGQDRIG